jgi:hypothetical protein
LDTTLLVAVAPRTQIRQEVHHADQEEAGDDGQVPASLQVPAARVRLWDPADPPRYTLSLSVWRWGLMFVVITTAVVGFLRRPPAGRPTHHGYPLGGRAAS